MTTALKLRRRSSSLAALEARRGRPQGGGSVTALWRDPAQPSGTPAPPAGAQAARHGARGFSPGFDPLAIELRYRMFIPSPAIQGPPFSSDFGGDGRGFSYDDGTSRGEIVGIAHLEPSLAVGRIETVARHWSPTYAYAKDDTVAVPGKPGWWRNKRPGAQASDQATLAVSDANLRFDRQVPGNRGIRIMAEGATAVTIVASGANPLVRLAPKIDANVSVLFRNRNGVIEAMALGFHDGFPAHELYVNGIALYTYDPVAAGKGPLSLVGVGDIDAETGWVPVSRTYTVRIGAGAQSLSVSAGGAELDLATPAAGDPWNIGEERAPAQEGKPPAESLSRPRLLPMDEGLPPAASNGATRRGARAEEGRTPAGAAEAGRAPSGGASARGAMAEAAELPVDRTPEAHAVFDRMGRSMHLARTFDLGSVDVDAMLDRAERSLSLGSPPEPPPPPPAEADELDDLELLSEIASLTAKVAPAPPPRQVGEVTEGTRDEGPTEEKAPVAPGAAAVGGWSDEEWSDEERPDEERPDEERPDKERPDKERPHGAEPNGQGPDGEGRRKAASRDAEPAREAIGRKIGIGANGAKEIEEEEHGHAAE
jgi:hypothetical protein